MTKPVPQMATIQLGSACHAQGIIIDRHGDGQVTISTAVAQTDKGLFRGVPIFPVQTVCEVS